MRVETASAALLDQVRDSDDFRILLRTTKPGRQISSRHAGPVPEAEPLSDVIGLHSAGAPEQVVAELLADRESSYEKVSAIVGDLPRVAVWDVDLVEAETRERLGASGDAGPIEQAALRALDVHATVEQIVDLGRDLVLTVALGWLFGPATTVLVVGRALLGVLDAMQEYARFEVMSLLAQSDLLAPTNRARRLLTRDPSLLPLLAAVVGAAGDLAAIGRLPQFVQKLEKAGLMLSVAALTDEAIAGLFAAEES